MDYSLNKEEIIDIYVRNLPHWQQKGKLQFITFHLQDSIPLEKQRELGLMRQEWHKKNPKPWTELQQKNYHRLFNKQIERWLDNGYGACYLRDKDIAQIVVDSLEYFNEERYFLPTYVVMPNHVHVLTLLYGELTTTDVCKSWKNYTARLINRKLGMSGNLWHSESWDRIIRNGEHMENVINYILKNIRQGGVLWKLLER